MSEWRRFGWLLFALRFVAMGYLWDMQTAGEQWQAFVMGAGCMWALWKAAA